MWYSKITKNINEIPNFISHYEKELEEARNEVSIYGNLEKNIRDLPGITEYRFNQLQEIESVLKYLEIQMRSLKKQKYVEYERYQKALSSTEVQKYVDGEDDIVDFDVIINNVALIRNKFLGIMKGLENKQWMAGHIVRLRVSGMEDIVV